MTQNNNSSPLHSPEPSKQEKPATSKRAYHSPAALQEFGQLRTLTLGGVAYGFVDVGLYSG